MQAACALCGSRARYAVTLAGLPGVKPAGACDAHLSTTVTRMTGRGGAASATVYVLELGMPPEASPGVKDIAEQVRRIAADSRDRKRAHLMEDRLYAAVLALIAQGADGAADLAAAALQTQRYGFERTAG